MMQIISYRKSRLFGRLWASRRCWWGLLLALFFGSISGKMTGFGGSGDGGDGSIGVAAELCSVFTCLPTDS